MGNSRPRTTPVRFGGDVCHPETRRRVFDLQGLDGSGVDRGFGDNPIPSAHKRRIWERVRDTLPVRRDRMMRSDIVLDSRLCRFLADPDGPQYEFAVHNGAHFYAQMLPRDFLMRCGANDISLPIPRKTKSLFRRIRMGRRMGPSTRLLTLQATNDKGGSAELLSDYDGNYAVKIVAA